MAYFELFDTIGEELDGNPILHAPKTRIERERHIAPIDSIVKRSNLKLFDGLKSFYEELEQIVFTWNLKKEVLDEKIEKLEADDYVCGSINVLKFESMIFGPTPEGWNPAIWQPEMSAEDIEAHKPFRPFDYADSRVAAGFMVQDGEIKDEVYLYYLRGSFSEIFDMEMNLEEYLRLLHKTRGFADWQVAWLFRNGYEYDFMMHYFPQIFPDVDISEFVGAR